LPVVWAIYFPLLPRLLHRKRKQGFTPVHAYDAFIETIDFRDLGITLDSHKVGNSEYHPHAMLKLLVYGYSYGIRSSRKVEPVITITPSKNFTVELKVTSITNLKAYSVTLSYDPTLLSLQEVTEGTFFSSEGETFFYRDIDNQGGSVLIDCAILGRDLSVSGEGTLATLSFTCLEVGSTSITFEFTDTREAYNKVIVTTKKNAVIKSK
jgi:hypothetical protein